MSELQTLTIPPEDEERPVRIHPMGIVLTNDAYHCRPKHLWPKEIDQAKPEWLPPMERYLAAFCKPIRTIADEIKCVACDLQVTGHHVGLNHPQFRDRVRFKKEGTWEGRCSGCGYPCRLLHRIYLGQQPLVELRGFPLFYHPSATQRTT